ncbi:yeats family-domain-containing protein [Fimicolochytrium jonesii]|uniref:yeats family-domain-containing protein n=1 Tax=Fimicolochytrium jonesii TaxID=1396493 RepID=UPI0022FF1482|nr:yeats family-domain-containing protein [Fimicolochytrium jonesii]KAI8815956.1 yeats family-domain-containing protein [Fimicolochytrium jonesii]
MSYPSETVRSALPHDGITADEGSRFYVKRRVLLGNASRFIPPDQRETGMEKYLFRWKVYLQGPPETPDITPFIRKVRFYLHPDYRPYDVVEVSDPPFHLTRYGWGEFPVRVQLYFGDERNKPVNLIHVLKLDQIKTGRQLVGAERFIDLELDRNTVFGESREPAKPVAGVEPPDKEKEETAAAADNAAAEQKRVDKILADLAGRWPIIRAAGTGSFLPYSTAKSIAAYMAWPLGKRKATEFQRAKQILQSAQSHTAALPLLQNLTLKDILKWCIDTNRTPTSRKPTSSSASSTTKPATTKKCVEYCRYCGIAGAHDGDDAVCMRRPTMWKGRVWSLAPAGLEGVVKGEGINTGDINVHNLSDPTNIISSTSYDWSNTPHPTATDSELAWVTQTVAQLRLPGWPGNRGRVEGLNYDGGAAGVVFEAVRSFTRRLIECAVEEYRRDEETDAATPMDKLDGGILSPHTSLPRIEGAQTTQPFKEENPALASQTEAQAQPDTQTLPAQPPTSTPLAPAPATAADPTTPTTATAKPTTNPFSRLLVPFHVYRGIMKTEEMDFLTGAGLAGE